MVLLTPTATKPGVAVSPSSFSPFSLPTLPHFSSASGCQQCLGGKFTWSVSKSVCKKAENPPVSPCSAQSPVWGSSTGTKVHPRSSQRQLFHSHSETTTTVHKEKAEELVSCFCSNLPHLFGIQLLIMFLSVWQSELMAAEQTGTPNEHSPPCTEELKQCRTPTTLLTSS